MADVLLVAVSKEIISSSFASYDQDACSGRSPLHYAVESENLALCNFLLENGCNVNSTTFSGMA